MSRLQLELWQRRMCHIVLRDIQIAYERAGFAEIAPFNASCLEPFLKDGLSDACGKAWAALDPQAWMNEPGDGTRSDDLYEATGEILR
jgi:hypothetical protein